MPAADNDGDTLTFRLATKAETTGSATRGGNPDGMTMSNGLVQWTPTTNGLYGGQVIVADSYSTVAVDYLLRVQDSKVSCSLARRAWLPLPPPPHLFHMCAT